MAGSTKTAFSLTYRQQKNIVDGKDMIHGEAAEWIEIFIFKQKKYIQQNLKLQSRHVEAG